MSTASFTAGLRGVWARLTPGRRGLVAGLFFGLAAGWWFDFGQGASTWLVLRVSTEREILCRVSAREQSGEGRRVRRTRLVPEIRQYRLDLGGTRNRGRISVGFRATEGARFTIQAIGLEKAGRETHWCNLAALADDPNAVEGTSLEPAPEGTAIRFIFYRCSLRLPYDLRHRPGAKLEKGIELVGSILLWAAGGGLLGAVVAGVAWAPRRTPADPKLALALTLAGALVAAMAAAAPFNAHPDEIWHFSAAGYYLSESSPPAAHDPLAAPSYSAFRYSYLATRDLVYPAVGFWMRCVDWWIQGSTFPFLTARALPVLLFACMAWGFLRRGALSHAAVLLLSGQVWISFASVNSEFLPLTAALCVGCALSVPGTGLDRWLRGLPGTGLAPALLAGLGLALLWFAKPNFRVCIPFFLLVLALRPLLDRVPAPQTPDVPGGASWRRIAALLLVSALVAGLAAAFFALRPPAQGIGHNPNRQQVQVTKSQELRIQSVDNLRRQGVGFRELLFERGWAKRTFSSLFGGYGWMRIFHSNAFYTGVWTTALVLLAALAFAALHSRSAPRIAIVGAAFAGTGATIVAAAWWSWTVSFQPQGRYLFPALPMLATAAQFLRTYMPQRTTRAACTILFVSALYSFLVNALVYISRIDHSDFL